ncbi:MAG TPA: ATP-dependent Clp protease proteolytic subunit [Terrimicrobiaceae bacterium]
MKEFRENARRSILVGGDIDEKLVHRLTPEICRLRSESSDPITVYINSRGGFTVCAEQIRALLTTPDQEGRLCRVVTVATSRADSAAARLLALGDYAIAYPSAAIHCHGSRLSDEEITSDKAEFLAASLKKSNDEFALRLARRIFARMAFHFANLRGTFEDIRKSTREQGKAINSDLECFAFAIHEKLSSDFRKLPQSAFFQHELLVEMSHFIFGKLKFSEKDPWAKTEVKLLKLLLDFELRKRGSKTWSLSDGGIDDLSLDFKSLADYLFGPHKKELEEHLKSFGVLFLKPEVMVEFKQRREEGHHRANELLEDKAKPIVEPMWYFVVSLCRLLQNGEYGLTAKDAYSGGRLRSWGAPRGQVTSRRRFVETLSVTGP